MLGEFVCATRAFPTILRVYRKTRDASGLVICRNSGCYVSSKKRQKSTSSSPHALAGRCSSRGRLLSSDIVRECPGTHFSLSSIGYLIRQSASSKQIPYACGRSTDASCSRFTVLKVKLVNTNSSRLQFLPACDAIITVCQDMVYARGGPIRGRVSLRIIPTIARWSWVSSLHGRPRSFPGDVTIHCRRLIECSGSGGTNRVLLLRENGEEGSGVYHGQ